MLPPHPFGSMMKLRNGLAKAFVSVVHSNCKIFCKQHEFNVHKSLLITESDYFEAALKEGSFRLTTRQYEGVIRVIELEALPAAVEDQSDVDGTLDDPKIIKLMISTPNAPTISSADAELVAHTKVFAAAIKYQVDGIRDLAAYNFANTFKSSWNSDSFVEAVSLVYRSTPEDVTQLRDIVLKIILDKFETLKECLCVKEALCSI